MTSSKNFLENSPESTLSPALLVIENQIVFVRYKAQKIEICHQVDFIKFPLSNQCAWYACDKS